MYCRVRKSVHQTGISGGFRGGSLEHPFETKIFNFHGEFSEKSGNIDKRSYKINKLNPPL